MTGNQTCSIIRIGSLQRIITKLIELRLPSKQTQNLILDLIIIRFIIKSNFIQLCF